MSRQEETNEVSSADLADRLKSVLESEAGIEMAKQAYQRELKRLHDAYGPGPYAVEVQHGSGRPTLRKFSIVCRTWKNGETGWFQREWEGEKAKQRPKRRRKAAAATKTA